MTKDMIVKAAQEAAARRNEVFALNDLRVDLTARRVWKKRQACAADPAGICSAGDADPQA